jgi:hypothetical protein
MRATSVAVLVLLTLPAFAASQTAKPRPEIGVRGGVLRITEKDDFGSRTSTTLALPAGFFIAPGGIHATFFVSPRIALEPQLGFLRISDENDSFSLLTLAGQVNAFLGPDATRAPYLFGQVATLREDDSGSSESQTGFGGGLGYRKVHRESIALRYEARFRRWTGRGLTTNELGFLIGIGAVIR